MLAQKRKSNSWKNAAAQSSSMPGSPDNENNIMRNDTMPVWSEHSLREVENELSLWHRLLVEVDGTPGQTGRTCPWDACLFSFDPGLENDCTRLHCSDLFRGRIAISL